MVAASAKKSFSNIKLALLFATNFSFDEKTSDARYFLMTSLKFILKSKCK